MTKNLPSTFLRITTSNFKKCSLQCLENFVKTNFKILIKILLIKNKKTILFFLDNIFNFLMTEFFKIYQGTFPGCLKYLSQKIEKIDL